MRGPMIICARRSMATAVGESVLGWARECNYAAVFSQAVFHDALAGPKST